MPKKDPSLLNIQTKIGNSFLRAFYPIDYRSNKNVLKKVDELLGREVAGLRSMADTTGRVAQKIGRTFGVLGRDLSEMQEAFYRLQMTIQSGDEILSNRLQGMENAYDNIAGFLPDLPMFLSRRTPKGKTRPPKGNPSPSSKQNEPGTKNKRPKGKYFIPRGMTAVALAVGLYELWNELQALDPNMKKGEYRQAVLQILTRAAGSFGLVWVGAVVGAGVGGVLGFGFGAIPGFIAGLIGGTVADYYFGESVDQLADKVVDYLYTGDEEEETSSESLPTGADAAIVERDVPTPPLDPVNQQASTEVRESVQVAPPIVGPTPPAPPMLQEVGGPTIWPDPLPAFDMSVPPPMDDTGSKARAASSEALNKIKVTPLTGASGSVTQSEDKAREIWSSPWSKLNGQEITIPGGPFNDTTATISTGSDQAGGIQPGQGVGSVQVIEAYGPGRPGRPVQAIRDIAVRAAESVGMTQIKFTSGVGDYISSERRARGQKTTKHSEGIALDVTGFADQAQRVAFMQAARQLGAGGIGAYNDGSVHIDLGPQREWDGAVGVHGLADGGRVSKPTLALIGEGGEPEYVVPQSKAIKFAHEMIAARPQTRTKRHTHVMVVPILT